MIDRRTGEPKASLADPFVQNIVYSYYGAPIPGTMGNIIAYLRRRRALTPSILVNWSTGQLVNGNRGLRLAQFYYLFHYSAVGSGRIYLSDANRGEFNALMKPQAASWGGGWAPHSEEMIGNMILTDTPGFVSTNKAIYAIPTQGGTHTPVWSAAAGGDMALTSDGTLIVTGQRWTTAILARSPLSTAIKRLIAIIWRLAGSLHASSRWVSDGI
jgi:hypothetical protein